MTLSTGAFRKKYVNNNGRKIAECVLFAFATASSFYAAVCLRNNNCKPVNGTESYEYEVQWTCPDNYYNPLATLILNTERGTLEEFFRYPEILSTSVVKEENTSDLVGDLLIYFCLWYFFTVTTFGIWVPAGIFVPGMLIGCCMGMLYLDLMLDGFHLSLLRVGGQSYLVIGAASFLASYTRLTYSLAVLMMETTSSINLFIPVLITIMVAHVVAKMFNRSLYEYTIRAKQMPLLRNHVPKVNKNLRVRTMLKELFNEREGQELEVVESVCSVERLTECLTNPANYNTISVVNMYGCLVGLVPKSVVIVLIE